jgi:MFS family permease
MGHLERWTVALLFSLLIGHLATDLFVKFLRKTKKDVDPEQEKQFRCFVERQKSKIIFAVPSWLMGILERSFFTLLVGADVNGAGVAMMTWLAVKMASNWHKISSRRAEARNYGLTALAGGMYSMVFALIGGLIYRDFFQFCHLGKEISMSPKFMLTIAILLGVAGVFFIAFGLIIKEGIEKDFNQGALKNEIEKKGTPQNVKQNRPVFYIGLLLISIAALIQIWFILCS